MKNRLKWIVLILFLNFNFKAQDSFQEDTTKIVLSKSNPKEQIKQQIIYCSVHKNFNPMVSFFADEVILIIQIDSTTTKRYLGTDYEILEMFINIANKIEYNYFDEDDFQAEMGYIYILMFQDKHVFFFLLDEKNEISKIAYRLK